MDKCEAVLYIRSYYDICTAGLWEARRKRNGENNTKGDLYLFSYSRWACIEAMQAVIAEPDRDVADILQHLYNRFEEYSTYDSKASSMFSCARDTVMDIWDHIAYPNDDYTCIH